MGYISYTWKVVLSSTTTTTTTTTTNNNNNGDLYGLYLLILGRLYLVSVPYHTKRGRQGKVLLHSYHIILLGTRCNNFFFTTVQLRQWAKTSLLSRIYDHTQTHHTRQNSSGLVTGSTQRPLPDNTQHSQQTNTHAAGGIRTLNPSKRVAVDPRLRPLGHRDRHAKTLNSRVIRWVTTLLLKIPNDKASSCN